MQVQSTQSNAETLQDQLICPVLLEPLSQAVSLVPCAHKVQQSVAEKIFGETTNGWLVQSNEPCPVCRTSILGYMTDHSTRNIVKQLFELQESEINAMLVLMKKTLAEKSISVEKDVLVEIPYPGKPAKFVYKSGNWHLPNPVAYFRRFMIFESITEKSLLTGFSVWESNNGDVSINLDFFKKYTCLTGSSKNYKGVKKYLKKFGLIPDFSTFHFGYQSEDRDQLKIFFNILANNNEIPVSHFEMIRDLVSKETHNG